MEDNYGGNRVKDWDNESAELLFADGPYRYLRKTLEDGQSYAPDGLGSYTIYVLESAEGVSVTSDTGELSVGDALQVEDNVISVTAKGGAVTILCAGVSDVQKDKDVHITKADDLKKVVKPWGHELWINGQHPGYALKQIFIKGPHKTSLQYHHFKEETNVLFEGNAKLHYKTNHGVENDAVTAEDIGTVDVTPLSSVSVTPNIVHRIEALDNVLLYEVSTPHLDDVIRISDDAKRPDGRIDAEHSA